MKRTLVTGGTGFIGQHLVGKLLEDGEKPLVVIRPDSDTTVFERFSKHVDFWTFDGSHMSLENCFKKWDVEIVFHLATCFVINHEAEHIDNLVDSNITFGLKLVEAMTKSGVKKFVNVATNWQYYHSENYRPLNLYAATKQAFEDILTFYSNAKNLRVASVILFDTYGDNDQRAKLLPLLLSKKIGHAPIELSPGEQLMDLTHVDQVVDALLKAGERLGGNGEQFKRYIAASGEAKSLRETVESLCESYGLQPILLWGAAEYREREIFDIRLYEKFENLLEQKDKENESFEQSRRNN